MDTVQISARAVRDALPGDRARRDRLGEENARLSARVRELEEQLRRERAHSEGLARGLPAMADRVATFRKEGAAEQPAAEAPPLQVLAVQPRAAA